MTWKVFGIYNWGDKPTDLVANEEINRVNWQEGIQQDVK
jgi:hypothetical protein